MRGRREEPGNEATNKLYLLLSLLGNCTGLIIELHYVKCKVCSFYNF